MYEDYYSRQVGGLMPVFAGSRHHKATDSEAFWEVSFVDSLFYSLNRMAKQLHRMP